MLHVFVCFEFLFLYIFLGVFTYVLDGEQQTCFGTLYPETWGFHFFQLDLRILFKMVVPPPPLIVFHHQTWAKFLKQVSVLDEEFMNDMFRPSVFFSTRKCFGGEFGQCEALGGSISGSEFSIQTSSSFAYPSRGVGSWMYDMMYWHIGFTYHHISHYVFHCHEPCFCWKRLWWWIFCGWNIVCSLHVLC